jgi:hypothetical protein
MDEHRQVQTGAAGCHAQAWITWNATMPANSDGAALSLGHSAKDMPRR